jgi:hypothetical protein
MALPDTQETDVQGIILRYLELVHVRAWRTNCGVFHRGGHHIRGAPGGTPDIIGYPPDGRFLAIECKRERGRTVERTSQQIFIDDLNASGGVGFFARSLREVEVRIDAETRNCRLANGITGKVSVRSGNGKESQR